VSDDEVESLTKLARTAARGAKGLANAVVDAAPRVPIRDQRALVEQHGGLTGAALAAELIRKASRSSAAVGAASGALMSAEELAPPAWITIPFELVVETVAIALIELKLVGELHNAHGVPIAGIADLLKAWAERRGVTPATLGRKGGMADALGRGTRNELVRMVRRRLLARLGRNLSSLAPLLAGAVAGAELNRRATRSLGEAVVRDLAAVRVSSP
jgi:hypothetical protein